MDLQNSSWKFVYQGDLVGVEKHVTKGYERAVRPPGVRLILNNADGQILLTKEFRHEQGGVDYRLPGGKVVDDLASYLAIRSDDQKLRLAVLKAAELEAKQEAGIDQIGDLKIFQKSVAGASVEWDLYYLTGEVLATSHQELDGDEKDHGIEIGYYSKEAVTEFLKTGAISEDRSAGVLTRFLALK